MFSLKAHTVVSNEIEIQRSRFITTVARADTEGLAREVIATARQTYPDARHHCSAFVIKSEGRNEIGHSNDDGEPSGTAGMPMLEVIRRRQLVNVVAVVTRYFGGVLLGAGGLVRAYSTSVSTALDQAPLVELVEGELWRVNADYATAGRLEAELRSHDYPILNTTYTASVTLEIAATVPKRDHLNALIATVGQGQLSVVAGGSITLEVAPGEIPG